MFQNNQFVEELISCIKSNLIVITQDKLEKIFSEHLNKDRKIHMWITPCSLCTTILIAFLSAEFKDFAGLKKSVWEAFFFLSFLATLVWTIIAVFQALNNKASDKSFIDDILNNRDNKNFREINKTDCELIV